MTDSHYYVYVYIDPRNFEEFYYGKGQGTRKEAHLKDDSDSEKSRRIKEIIKVGLQPIIKVVARNLTSEQALLVEKTLLWKLGKNLTNIATGAYSENFRPHNTFHENLIGYDYSNGIYFYNIGEGKNRCWDDYRKYNFISAGQGPKWRDAIKGFKVGDLAAAYLKGKGFVGICKIVSEARPVREIIINGKPLLNNKLKCQGLSENADSDLNSEYVSLVDWLYSVPTSEAKWLAKSKLFTPQLVRASLNNQPDTIAFLEQQFSVPDLKALIL